MAFNPHTPDDVRQMLAAIGADSIEQLFDEIPQELRIKSLDGVPDALSEMQIGRLMTERAARDGRALSSLTTRHASLEDVFVSLTGRHLRDA